MYPEDVRAMKHSLRVCGTRCLNFTQGELRA